MSGCEAMLVLPPILFSTEVMSLLTLALFQISWSIVTESQCCLYIIVACVSGVVAILASRRVVFEPSDL